MAHQRPAFSVAWNLGWEKVGHHHHYHQVIWCHGTWFYINLVRWNIEHFIAMVSYGYYINTPWNQLHTGLDQVNKVYNVDVKTQSSVTYMYAIGTSTLCRTQTQCTVPFSGFHLSSVRVILAFASLEPCLVGYTFSSPRKQLNTAVSAIYEHAEADRCTAPWCVSREVTDLYVGAFLRVCVGDALGVMHELFILVCVTPFNWNNSSPFFQWKWRSKLSVNNMIWAEQGQQEIQRTLRQKSCDE